ncbi:hypothetical protein D3C72_2570390 [compost metagenome]
MFLGVELNFFIVYFFGKQNGVKEPDRPYQEQKTRQFEDINTIGSIRGLYKFIGH